jgi:hypothetical protein
LLGHLLSRLDLPAGNLIAAMPKKDHCEPMSLAEFSIALLLSLAE